MPRWIRTLLHLTPIVAGVSAVSVVGLLLFRALAPLEDLRAASNELGNYLQTVGGIYAVLLAFVVYVVWGQFNDARSYLDREATALVDLHRTSSGLPSRSRRAIQSGLRNYVDAVLRDEWPAMACADDQTNDQTIERVGEFLEQVWLAIHGCKPVNDCQHTVYSEVLTRFNQLTDLRTSRLSAARVRIPVAMTILLYTGAFVTVGSVYLLAFDKLWLHALVTAALAGAIAHILFLIRDLDDAFAGDWQIAKAPFERARKNFERAAHVVDVDVDAA